MKTIRLLNSIKRIAAEEAKKYRRGECDADTFVQDAAERCLNGSSECIHAIESIEDEIIHAPEDMRQAHLDAVGSELVKAASDFQRNADKSHDREIDLFCEIIDEKTQPWEHEALDKMMCEALKKRIEWSICSLITQKAAFILLDSLDRLWGIHMDAGKLEGTLSHFEVYCTMKDYLDRHRESGSDNSEREMKTTASDGEMGNGIADVMITGLRNMSSGFATDLNENQLLKLLELLKTTEPGEDMLADKFRPRVFVSPDTETEDWLNLFRAHSKKGMRVKWTMITKQGNIGKKPLRDLLCLLCSDKSQITTQMLNRFQLFDKNGKEGKPFTAQDLTEDCESTYHDMFVRMIDEAMKV